MSTQNSKSFSANVSHACSSWTICYTTMSQTAPNVSISVLSSLSCHKVQKHSKQMQHYHIVSDCPAEISQQYDIVSGDKYFWILQQGVERFIMGVPFPMATLSPYSLRIQNNVACGPGSSHDFFVYFWYFVHNMWKRTCDVDLWYNRCVVTGQEHQFTEG